MTLQEFSSLRDEYPAAGIVAVNGCFDVLHVGHVRFLRMARTLGSHLIVGLNSNRSVRALKGEGRPIYDEMDRQEILLSLAFVELVVIFEDVTAERFLKICAPTVWCKSVPWTLSTLNAREMIAVKSRGGKAVILPRQSPCSTTETLRKIHEL